MKRTIVALGLAAVVLIATASDAFAQRIRIGGPGGISIGSGGGWGSSGYYGSGYGSGYYGRGYGSGYYGSNYWGPGYGSNYSGYYGSPYYGNRYYNTWPSYSSGYYYGEPSYYDSSPNYYSSPGYAQFPSSSTSMYHDPNSAMITVMVPNPDAKVWFDDSPTQQRGMERSFHTPGLKQQGGSYTIKAQWTENGRNVDQQRDVRVQPGQSVTVDFRQPAGENVPRPGAQPQK